MRIVISSGHGLHVPGARDIIDEVAEARRVTDRVAKILQGVGTEVLVFHDDTTRPPASTVNTINNFHNGQIRDLDVSVHFNSVAGGTRDAGIGVETLYREGNSDMRLLASNISRAISEASGLILRRGDGSWGRADLGFLNRTNINRAVLLEVCFVNSRTDVRLYQEHFEAICQAIAEALIGREIAVEPPIQPNIPKQEPPTPRTITLDILGKVQEIGGYIKNGTTFVRLTEFAVALGFSATWDDQRRIPVIDRRIAVEKEPTNANERLRLENVNEAELQQAYDDLRLLKIITHWEARGEDEKGQILVVNVIKNRLKSPNFPNTLHEVIFAQGAFTPTTRPRF